MNFYDFRQQNYHFFLLIIKIFLYYFAHLIKQMAENCFHCGQEIEKDRIFFDEKAFCCNGCKSVYEILNANNLGNFYELNKILELDQTKISLSLII